MMASVYDPDAFQQRVKYAVECIIAGRTRTRHFDTCFEMFDGDAVAVAVYRRSLKNARLAENLWKALGKDSVMGAVERLKDVPTGQLAAEARREREEGRRRIRPQPELPVGAEGENIPHENLAVDDEQEAADPLPATEPPRRPSLPGCRRRMQEDLMTAEELEAVSDEDRSFRVGSKVKLYWTNSGRSYNGVGTVIKLNAKSLSATLDREVGSPSDPLNYYPAGQKVTVPRIDGARRWTSNNCARAYDPSAGSADNGSSRNAV